MNNFARALRLALRYRLNVVGCIMSAVAVALLWMVSLTAVFPVIDVIMTDRALPQWIDDELVKYDAAGCGSSWRIGPIASRANNHRGGHSASPAT